MEMSTTPVKSSFLRRLMGAVMLDTGTYEEIEADRSATLQAFVVVLMSSVAAGIGAMGFGQRTLSVLAFNGVVALLAWAAWALVTFEIGVRLMPQPQTQSSVLELMRTIGFAAAPGLLQAAGILPGATVPIFVVSALWMLAAMVVAVRQALDYDSTVRAVMVCALGWVLAIAIALVSGFIFGSSVS
jgi:hypothetical protein